MKSIVVAAALCAVSGAHMTWAQTRAFNDFAPRLFK